MFILVIKKLSYDRVWDQNISDSQALFWYSVIILEMPKHFVLMFCRRANLTLFLAFT